MRTVFVSASSTAIPSGFCESPKNIIVYGAAPDRIFQPYRDRGINIIVFESEFAKTRKQVTA